MDDLGVPPFMETPINYFSTSPPFSRLPGTQRPALALQMIQKKASAMRPAEQCLSHIVIVAINSKYGKLFN
jgi:hypothetical protein